MFISHLNYRKLLPAYSTLTLEKTGKDEFNEGMLTITELSLFHHWTGALQALKTQQCYHILDSFL